jgi:hypothetical protein
VRERPEAIEAVRKLTIQVDQPTHNTRALITPIVVSHLLIIGVHLTPLASQEIPTSPTVKLITAIVTFCIILGVAIPILLVCIIGGILRLQKDFDFALQLVHISRGLWITSLPIPILIYIAILIFQPIKLFAPTERTKGMLAVAAVYVLAQVGIWFMLSTEELSLRTKIEAALAM